MKTWMRSRWSSAIGVGLLLLATLAQAGIATPAAQPQAWERDPGAGYDPSTNTFRIFAHREGLVGHTTANGHVIQPNDFFVALPCFCVLSSKGGYEFQVKIEYEGNSVTVPVWDVGPWNTDDNYWDPPEERNWSGLPRGVPVAEAAYYDGYNGGLDDRGREVRSPAGMDIGDGAFYALGMTDSDWVDVTFLWLEPEHETVLAELPPLREPFSDIQTTWWDERPPLEPQPAIEDGRYDYVEQTGHNVPKQLMEFWRANGHWRANGLPVSEFHRSIGRDGSVRYIQYFERAVLEMVWPEDGSAPFVVARPLGYDTYIDPEANEPIEPFTADDWAFYVPETGHSVGGGFRRYFEAHGGTAVFGLPLSEEWRTTAPNGEPVVYQVYERARFEWWPQRPGAPDEITLGLLGIELLERHGWWGEPE